MSEQIRTDRNSSQTLPEDEDNAFRETLRNEFLDDHDYMVGYAESFLNSWVALQIKTLREQRGMTQQQLAEAIGTKQAGVSRLENINYTSWKTETLRKIARALGVRLRISFETFGDLLDEAASLDRSAMLRPACTEDPKLQKPQEPGRSPSRVVVREPASPSRKVFDISKYNPTKKETISEWRAGTRAVI